MTDKAKKPVKLAASDTGGKDNKKTTKIVLFASAAVLVVALAVSAFLLLGNTKVSQDRIERVIDHGTALKGVSIGGIDISGMTEEEAQKATKDINDDLLAKAVFNFDIDGELVKYTAESFNLSTDYDDVFAQAINFGHTGTFEERKEAAEAARGEGVSFEVNIHITEADAEKGVAQLKTEMDAEPVEASCEFMPWGYLADGTNAKYEPDINAMIKANAKRDDFERPELVRLAEEDKPNKYRYQYYRYNKFIEDYIPVDADIARFLYIEDVKGLVIDKDATVKLVMSAVENDDYSKIVVPVQVTETNTKIEDIKKNTQLISSWTSSYYTHRSYNRNYNVGKMSSVVCGVIIQPGEEWSINEEAGPRKTSLGWREAAGISGGAFVQEAGGGVCQMSSTTYNAALRSGLEIIDSSRHSIVSDYIPIGLDATISTGRPDLVFKNPYDVPVYLVSYVNGKDYNVTVEIYGPPVVNEEYGPVILNFTSKELSRKGTGTVTTYYNQTQTPDGKAIPAGASVEYAKARTGRQAQTYIHYLALDGTELKKEKFYYHWYKPVNGRTYVNGPDPATIPPEPTPGPTDPTTDPTPKPEETGGGDEG